MEERAVCYYCATIYPADQPKCPLCGSTKRSEDFVIPQRRERMTDEERKRRQKGGKFAAQKPPVKKKAQATDKNRETNINRKAFLVGALIFLCLTVLVLFWFIADMIGWIPGFENTVDRDPQTSVTVNVECTDILAEPTRMTFAAPAEEQELTISVNAACEEKLYCTSNDPDVVAILESTDTFEGTEIKSITFRVASVAEGDTAITISCGNRTIAVPVTVAAASENGEPVEIPDNFVPELNWSEVEFTTMEDSVTLKVANLPAGATVIWSSSDESVATVDEQGVVRPVSPGQVTVTCDVNGRTSQVTIHCDVNAGGGTQSTVNDDGAHLESTDVSIRVGEKFSIYLYNSKSEHIDGVSYVVEDAAICEVVDNYCKGLSRGTTRVRVIYGDREFICIVRVG